MSPVKIHGSITVGFEKCTITETQDEDFKIAFNNMFDILKEKIYESIKEICGGKISSAMEWRIKPQFYK